MPLVTAKEFLDRAKGDVWDKVLSHGPAETLLNALTTGGVTAGDQTGQLSVGPGGFTITNMGKPDDSSGATPVAPMDRSKLWSLNVNPSGGSFSKGDFAAGGTFGPNKSGFISKGPLRLDAGYGVVNPYTPSENLQDPRLTAAQQFSKQGTPEPWAKLGFEFGTPTKQRAAGVASDFQSKSALDEAVAPFVKQEQDAPLKSARDEAEQFINDYRSQNQDAWWRP